MPVPNIGKRRVLLKKYSEPVFDGKYYPTEDVKKPAKRALKPGVAKLRASITPGTVLILLSGKYRGKRVIFLKQLESGLLLVTGPFSVNKVPLRRVNQAYVIATSTKVDVSRVDVSAATDKLLAAKEERAEKAKALRGKGEEAFLELQKTAGKKDASEERKALQAKVDAAIKLDATMTKYLQSRFALSKGQAPHNMVF